MRVLESFRYFALAELLGGVESLVSHPWTMSHASIPEPQRRAIGITPQLDQVVCRPGGSPTI